MTDKYVFTPATVAQVQSWKINDIYTHVISIDNFLKTSNNTMKALDTLMMELVCYPFINNQCITTLLNIPNTVIYIDLFTINTDSIGIPSKDDVKESIISALEKMYHVPEKSVDSKCNFMSWDINGDYSQDYETRILKDLNEDTINNTSPGSKSDTSSTIKDNVINKTDDTNQNITDNLVTPNTFDENKPDMIKSNIIEKDKYSYFFGLDCTQFYTRDIKANCCFISNYYTIDDLEKVDYIKLVSNYTLSEFSSIEFFIIDGTKTIPILESNEKVIQKERIFQGTLPSFAIDDSVPYTIYKDNIIISKNLEDIINNSDGIYTITYTPKNGWNYKPQNNNIKIKAIMRLYDKYYDSPVLSNIYIKIYGGDSVWQESI